MIRKVIASLLLVASMSAAFGTTALAASRLEFALRTSAQGSDDAMSFVGFTVPRATAIQTHKFEVTAYTSTIEECDGNPFITADGSVVADGIIATNALPFGTKVRIPQYFGEKVFTVHDRMNTRYWKRIDIWMNDKNAMRQWGYKRNVTIEVLELGNNKTKWDQWKGRTAELNRIGKYGPDA